MIYDGRQAASILKEELQKRVALLPYLPVLHIISASTHPSIRSFITIKRKFAEAIDVTMREYVFPETVNEDELIEKIKQLSVDNNSDGIIVQLPLPSHMNTTRVLNIVPKKLDVDVLGQDACESFIRDGSPLPTVAGAISHILHDTHVDLHNKKVIVIGNGKLVGAPVATWFKHQGVTPVIVDITTDEATHMMHYQEADIVVSGIGSPHHLLPEYFKKGVILIDAGTSEQSGILVGDCAPSCAEIASIFTPVPGGVGPLTVAHLFMNVVAHEEKKYKV